MADENKSAMVALLPTTSDWCRIELPHLTIVYAGEIKNLKPTDFNSMGKLASSISILMPPLKLKVTGIEIFGDDEKVDVLRLLPSAELLAIRQMLESWDVSDFMFRPHSTIGPTGFTNKPIPDSLVFDRILVAFGDESLTFWLKK